MRLSEIVFQGIFGATNPSRLKIEPEFHHLRLPRLVEPRAFQNMIASLLYPDVIDASALSADVQAAGTFRIGAVLEVDRRRYKVFRQNDAESIVLQDVTSGANEVARGAAAVARALRKLLYLPPIEDFRVFHMWALPEVVEGSGGAGAGGPRSKEQQRLVDLYQSALKIEAVDLKIENCRVAIKDIEREREEVGRPLIGLRRLEEHIASMSAVRDLTPEELTQIQDYKRTQAELSRKVQGLESELEEIALSGAAESEGDANGPDLRPVIIATLVLALTLYVVSGILDMRLIALVNILVLGGTTFLIIRHFDQLAASRTGQLRLDSINRRLSAAEQERKNHRESTSGLLDRLGVNSYMAFEQLMQAYEDDTARLKQMKADGVGREVEAQVQALDAKIAGVEADLTALQAERAGLGDYTMPSYELERALEDEGLDPRQFKSQRDVPSIPMPKNPTGTWIDAFPSMVELARARGVVDSAGLKPNAQQVWEKLAVLLLGRTWRGLGLQANGELLAPRPLQQGLVEWAKRKPDMALLLVQTFAAAVAMGTDPQHAHGRCGIFVLSAPLESLDAERSSRLDNVFKSMASRAEVVVLSN